MSSNLLELVSYTDPYCTWCWGSEPILRKIEEAYGEQVKISFKMGGLVKEMSNFYDAQNQIGGPDWYRQVAAHWLEASSRHGMPVDEQIFFDIRDSNFSTYPANIAYKSAQLQDEISANRFLRRMREGAAAERLDIQQLDIQAKLAKEVGLDSNQFIKDIESGRAKESFEKDLQECLNRGIRGFPTFLIRNLNTKDELFLRGYRQFSEFVDTFRKLTGDAIISVSSKVSKDSIFAFVRKHRKVATKEITEVFDLREKDANEYLISLVSEGMLNKDKVGNGFFYTVKLPDTM